MSEWRLVLPWRTGPTPREIPPGHEMEVRPAGGTCPFCDYAGPSEVLYENAGIYVIEPLNPVTPGHLLFIPRIHVSDFADDPDVVSDVFGEAVTYAAQIHRGYTQYNLIASQGEFATQTVKHLHVHLVPRRPNDGLRLPWSEVSGVLRGAVVAIRNELRDAAADSLRGYGHLALAKLAARLDAALAADSESA